MRALLDISVLLPLFDRGHIFHDRARNWWRQNMDLGWASCPLTQNGYLRVTSQKSYPRPVPLAAALQQFQSWAKPPRHEFWPDDVSVLDVEHIDHTRLLGPKQITDIYLLALAVKHGGRLVTLDASISVQAVKGAQKKHLVMV